MWTVRFFVDFLQCMVRTNTWLFWGPPSYLTECSSAKKQNQNQRVIFTDLEVSCSNTLLRAGSSSWWVAWGCVQLGFEQGNSVSTTFLCNVLKYLTVLILKMFPSTCLGAILCWHLHSLPLVLLFSVLWKCLGKGCCHLLHGGPQGSNWIPPQTALLPAEQALIPTVSCPYAMCPCPWWSW